MSLKKEEVKRVFDQVAHCYLDKAIYANEVGLRLLDRLDLMSLAPNSILDVGCATGFVCQQLKERFPQAKIKGVDSSSQMLKHFSTTDVVTACCDASALSFEQASFDLVVVNLTALWMRPAENFFCEAARVLKPGGLLLFSSFGPNTLTDLTNAWRHFDDQADIFQFTDMHDLGDSLGGCGFVDPVLEAEPLQFEYDDLATLAKDIQYAGFPLLLDNNWQNDSLVQFLDNNIPGYPTSDQGYLASFEVIYAHAWRSNLPLTVKSADETGTVEIDSATITKRS